MNRAALVSALKTCASVADPKSPSAFCKSVLLRAGKKSVEAIATDLNLTVRIDVPATGIEKPTSVVVPAARMLEVVNAAPGQEVSIEFEGGSAIEVKAGRWRGQVPLGGNPREFPGIPEHDAAFQSVPTSALADVIKGCKASICEDETRFHLCGIFLGAGNGVLHGVSTDGHRLTRMERPCAATWAPVIVPTKALKVLGETVDGADDVEILVEKSRMFVKAGWALLVIRLVDAAYPPWQQVVPAKPPKNAATFERAEMLSALDRARVAFGNAEIKHVHVDINGEARLTSQSTDGFYSSDEIDVDREGGEIATAANVKYLADALRVVGGERAVLRQGGPLEPIVIHAGEGPVPTIESGSFVMVLPARRA